MTMGFRGSRYTMYFLKEGVTVEARLGRWYYKQFLNLNGFI